MHSHQAKYYRAIFYRASLDDPLEDHGSLIQLMDQISVICRCEYQQTCALLIQLFDREATIFERAFTGGNRNPLVDMKQQQLMSRCRLTWLVMIIGAAVGGRVAFSSSDDHDLIDGDLICR
jgi:exportin-7